jgi:hypothetical protein
MPFEIKNIGENWRMIVAGNQKEIEKVNRVMRIEIDNTLSKM